MDDIKALVSVNSLNLPAEKMEEVRRLVVRREISFLSPEKEGGPFLLFLAGDDLQTISLKTNYPPEIIILTAMHYKWPEKAAQLQKDVTQQGMEFVQSEMLKTLLVATYISVQKQLGSVVAGKLDPKDCPLIPKNLASLEKLINMINTILHPPNSENKPTTNINAQNVQVNQVVGPPPKALDSPETREALLSEIENSSG